MTAPRVFFIGGSHTDAPLTPALIGAKAAGLVRLNLLGLRVPPALVLSTAVCQQFREKGTLCAGALVELSEGIHRLERATGLTLGGRHPLILSVRSSPPVSMPGMLDTVLNVGLDEHGVSGLIRRTGNPHLAWDAFRRLQRSFAETVGHVPATVFDECTASHLAKEGARSVQELDTLSLRDLSRRFGRLSRTVEGASIPQNPFGQVTAALEAVLASWDGSRARVYRRLNGIDERSGVAVLIQAMVFGNGGCRSGSGVAFTRNPSTGRNELYVDFAFDAQGEDVVAGHHAIDGNGGLPRLIPDVWTELEAVKHVLEQEYVDMQDFEFTVDDGALHVLQTRVGKRTAWAALHIAVDLVRAGAITPDVALQRLASYDLDAIHREMICAAGHQPIARATAAGLGVATGRIAFGTGHPRHLAQPGPVILVRSHLTTEDFPALAAADGIVSTFGGRTSHAAVVAREQGKVCLVGCAELHVDDRARVCSFGGRRFREGDLITLDGANGLIYADRLAVVIERPNDALAEIASWGMRAVTAPRA